MAGKFIVFEGIDGSGKSTQATLLADYLKSRGINVWLTKEPTDGQTGQLLQRIQHGEFKEFFKDEQSFNKFMTYLYSADRVGHYQQIKEHIENDEWVICDRYKYSTFVYNQTDLSLEIFDDFDGPDMAIFIDIPTELALERINSRSKSKEIFETQDKLKEVDNRYDFLASLKLFKAISGIGTVEEVFERIRNLIENTFLAKKEEQ